MVRLGCGVRLPGISLTDLPNEWKIGFSSGFYLPLDFSLTRVISSLTVSLALDSVFYRYSNVNSSLFSLLFLLSNFLISGSPNEFSLFLNAVLMSPDVSLFGKSNLVENEFLIGGIGVLRRVGPSSPC